MTQQQDGGAQQARRDFVKYTFFKVGPKWRAPLRLEGPASVYWENRLQPDKMKAEFAAVLGEFAGRVAVSSYSLVGTRGDADFLLWMVSPDLEGINGLSAALNRTELGAFLSVPYSYLGMTRRSPYVAEHRHEGQDGGGLRMVGRKYLFMYPFTKTHEWYQLPLAERQALMNEHFVIGHRYPNVKISTAYSFGLDDQEFVLGFETDDPGAFLDLVMELRESRARPYTLLDTPIFTCLSKPIAACLDDLG